MTRHITSVLGPEALQAEGLRETPEAWEDGLRAPTGPGFFEWWYFDFHFDDGTTAVIVYMTKPLLEQSGPLNPLVMATVTRPDGSKISETSIVPVGMFSASKEHCYVRAGESWVRGNLQTYELHAKTETLAAHLTLTGVVPAWRPGAGKSYYDEDRKRYFGWLPAIPYGTVEGRLSVDGKISIVKGVCYHDHNWGNVALNDVLSHWYWGRAHVGEYTLIFVEMTAVKSYGEQKIPVFMLAKGSQILTGDGMPLTLDVQNFVAHHEGRSYPETVDFDWKQGSDHIHLALRSPRIIEESSLLLNLPPWKRRLAHLIANPYYFRFEADLDLEICMGDLRANEKGKALYELMLLK